jgi:hypothetical protein
VLLDLHPEWAPDQIATLEASQLASEEYAIPSSQMKPCVGYLLAGGRSIAGRHDDAFCIAIYLRSLAWDRQRVEEAITRWAPKIQYSPRKAMRAVDSAFLKLADGSFKYHPPGLTKTGATYKTVIKPICTVVGCPANCAYYASSYAGLVGEDFQRFADLGWVELLQRKRWGSSVDVYRAVCERERQLSFAPGSPILMSYRQLADWTGRDYSGIGRSLARLDDLRVLNFHRGSGSGPRAKDKVASKVQRVVPIPAPTSALLAPCNKNR